MSQPKIIAIVSFTLLIGGLLIFIAQRGRVRYEPASMPPSPLPQPLRPEALQHPSLASSTPSTTPPSLRPQISPNNPPTPPPKPGTSSWVTYRNDKYAFHFRHPPTWNVSKEIGPPYRPPYLFDSIVETEDPLNRAGHISLLTFPFDKFVQEAEKGHLSLDDASSVDLSGKKFIKIFPLYPHSAQQTDYSWAFDFGANRTLLIRFTSFDTDEQRITSSLLAEIETMVNTLSHLK